MAEATLAIETRANAADIGLTIHRHGVGSLRGHDHRPLHAEKNQNGKVHLLLRMPSHSG